MNGDLRGLGEYYEMNFVIESCYLSLLRSQSLPVKVRFGKTLDRKITAVLDRRTTCEFIIQFHTFDRDMAIRRGYRTGKDLSHEVHDCVTAGTEMSDDLKFLRRGLGIDRRGVRYKTNELALQENAFADHITLGQDIAHERGCHRRTPG